MVKSSAPLAWVAGFSLLASLLVLAPSVYMLEVYERVVNSRSLTTLVVLTAAVVVAFAVMEVLEWVRSELLQQLGHRMDQALSPLLFRLMTQARAVHSGFLIQQPASDWRVLREFLPSPFVLSCFELPASVVFLLLVWLINPWLAVTVVLSAGVQ
ncbi:MAG: type I secretion system permease/ATPase, partial [Betaproteobacteria bacterium]|nr:type I secretion system permease/ATPase [Betaproteobacteria bacterium]